MTAQRSSPITPACRRCGSITEETIDHCGYTECGLTSVWLHRVRALACATCGERRFVIDGRRELHRRIARSLRSKETPLVAEEIRFLRDHLGLNTRRFADLLGVASETVSRWERGKPIARTADRLIRLLVAVRDGHDASVIGECAAISRSTEGPLPMRFTRAGDHWADTPAPAPAAIASSTE